MSLWNHSIFRNCFRILKISLACVRKTISQSPFVKRKHEVANIHTLCIENVFSVVVSVRKIPFRSVHIEPCSKLILVGLTLLDCSQSVALSVEIGISRVCSNPLVGISYRDYLLAVLMGVNPTYLLPQFVYLGKSIKACAATQCKVFCSRDLLNDLRICCCIKLCHTDYPSAWIEVIHASLNPPCYALHILICRNIGRSGEVDVIVIGHKVTEQGYFKLLRCRMELDIGISESTSV